MPDRSSIVNSDLWRTSLGERPRDKFADPRRYLRERLLDMREKAKVLATQIAGNIPGLTVHDITHLDSLWEMASMITGDRYPLNAAEGFVFGAAVLLHDAGMSVAAYENGLEDIKKTTEWRDAIAILANQREPNAFTREGITTPSIELSTEVLPMVLRALHARQAEELATVRWRVSGENQFEYLIDDGELRSFYAPAIGKIAHSHWWPISKLEVSLPPLVGASSTLPKTWTVDPLKIACLLRVADAIH